MPLTSYLHHPLAANDYFGSGGLQFSPMGTTMVACSSGDDPAGLDSGACYMFDSLTCVQQCKFFPDDSGVYMIDMMETWCWCSPRFVGSPDGRLLGLCQCLWLQRSLPQVWHSKQVPVEESALKVPAW